MRLPVVSRRHLWLCVGLLLLWVLLATLLRENFRLAIPWFNDYSDRGDYFRGGAWLPLRAVPYRDVMSEYPQVATYLFGLLYLPFLGQLDSPALFFQYSILFAFIMIFLLICLMVLLEGMLAGHKRNVVLALLLPASLYFSYNRFDVLPVLMVLLALLMARDEKWEAAGFWLGVGALTKWYPALLVLPVARHMLSKKVPLRRIGLFLAVFGATCVAILAPTYISGGWNAVLSPYVRYQTQRGVDPAALPALLSPLLQRLFTFPSASDLQTAFLLLQLSALPAVAFLNIRSFKHLVCACLLTLTTFMLFSRIYSPQWLLWILPLMILLAGDSGDLALMLLYGTVTYLEFPVLFLGSHVAAWAMLWIGWVNVGLLVWILVRAARRWVFLEREASTAVD